MLSAKELNNQGALLHQEGRLAEAKRAYAQALEIEPANSTALNNLAFALAQEGQYAEAIELYQESLRLNPESAMALTNLGNTYAAIGELARAVALLDQALQVEPEMTLALESISRILMAAGQYRAAVPYLERLLALRPGDVELWNALAGLHLRERNLGLAQEAVGRVLRQAPEHVGARQTQAYIYLAAGQVADAEVAFAQALAVDPGNEGIALDLAALKLVGQEPAAALGILTDLANSPRRELLRGMALDQLGDRAAAAEILVPLGQSVLGDEPEQARAYCRKRGIE